MSMTRKILRNSVREEAKDKGYKPSKTVSAWFNRYQETKHGVKKRRMNQAKGCRKRKNWRIHIQDALDLLNSKRG